MKPEKNMLCAGITGTKGKTTTAFMLSKILDKIGVRNVLVGSLGVYGISYPRSRNTTPPPTDIFEILSLAKNAGIGVAIIEVSSQALRDLRLYGIPFQIAAFTGFSRDHVGGSEHASLMEYMLSKRSLFTSYGARVAVINCDDPISDYMCAGVGRRVRCGFSQDAELRIGGFWDSHRGSSFLLNSTPVRVDMPGEYNAQNAALALGIAREITSLPIDSLAPALAGVRVSGRLELFNIEERQVIVDYAHNRQSLNAITALARRLFPGRIICVFGSVGDRAEERRRELAAAAEAGADISVITSDDSGSECPLSICAEIYSHFQDKSRAKVVVSRQHAIEYALSVAEPGDSVLVLGRGEERHMSQNGEIFEFSDLEFVRALQNKGRS